MHIDRDDEINLGGTSGKSELSIDGYVDGLVFDCSAEKVFTSDH